jgi:hypothetical protein
MSLGIAGDGDLQDARVAPAWEDKARAVKGYLPPALVFVATIITTCSQVGSLVGTSGKLRQN